LIAERLAAAGGQEHEHVAPSQRVADDLGLEGPERVNAKELLQRRWWTLGTSLHGPNSSSRKERTASRQTNEVLATGKDVSSHAGRALETLCRTRRTELFKQTAAPVVTPIQARFVP
jgi:hypothetical protein